MNQFSIINNQEYLYYGSLCRSLISSYSELSSISSSVANYPYSASFLCWFELILICSMPFSCRVTSSNFMTPRLPFTHLQDSYHQLRLTNAGYDIDKIPSYNMLVTSWNYLQKKSSIMKCLAHSVWVALVDCGCHYLPWMFPARMHSPTLHCGWTFTFGLWSWNSGKLLHILDLLCYTTPLKIPLNWNLLLQDTVMMGADYYQTESEIASLLAEGKVPIGIGKNTKIR